MKIGFELTGYEDIMNRLQDTVRNTILAFIACVMFIGSCMLCTTDITPEAHGIPFVAMIGFVVSVALGIYSIIRLSRKK
jgi:ubiquinone biosynthesis protein